MRAVNFPAWLEPLAAGRGITALAGVDGAGRTRPVEAEVVTPATLKCIEESIGTPSHYKLLPTSSRVGV